MQNEMASESLAIASFRVALDPQFIQELPRQIEAGMFDTGEPITSEDAAALRIFLSYAEGEGSISVDQNTDPTVTSTWIG